MRYYDTMDSELHKFLVFYQKMQSEIMVCYRPTEKSSWRDRCLFNEEGYDRTKLYNHRSILFNEVVIEFDSESQSENLESILLVARNMDIDNLSYAIWYSGNKSYHLHAFFDIQKHVSNALLKKSIMKHYCFGISRKPDFRLAADNHLIRAEFGIHEKTHKNKSIFKVIPLYPQINPISKAVWNLYYKEKERWLNRSMNQQVGSLVESPKVKYLLSSEKFRRHEDGRERALFMLIHILKPNYQDRQDELIHFLHEWYKYSGGFKLSYNDISKKIKYHWNRSYSFGERYVSELLEELGVKDTEL